MSDSPVNETPVDNSYTSRPGQQKAGVPVQSDDAPIDDPVANSNVDPDSDEQLGKYPHPSSSPKDRFLTPCAEKDENAAIDESNILDGGKTRGVKVPPGTYKEPGDEEGLPTEDGTSAGRQ
ncbi:hypothetical protein BC567DRAFT_208510 [Phyllosticta citribraziliensis]